MIIPSAINPYANALSRIQIELAELHYQTIGDPFHLLLLEAERIVAKNRSAAEMLGRRIDGKLGPSLDGGAEYISTTDAFDRVQESLHEAAQLGLLLLVGIREPLHQGTDQLVNQRPDIRGAVDPEASQRLLDAGDQLQQIVLKIAAEVRSADE